MSKKTIFRALTFALVIFSSFLLLRLGGSNDLVASLANLPGMADSPDSGVLVDLVKAIDEVYTNGKIKIEIYPFTRSVNNVVDGKADFHMPTPRNPAFPLPDTMAYRYWKEKYGTFSEVIFSHVDKPISKKTLDEAMAKGGSFPLKIEGSSAMSKIVPFPVIVTTNLTLSLKKVEGKRIDALIWAQEESDTTLKDLKIKTIRRELWMDFYDTIILPKGPEGDKTERILIEALNKLKTSGKLQQLYIKIHRPFDPWQPANMGW